MAVAMGMRLHRMYLKLDKMLFPSCKKNSCDLQKILSESHLTFFKKKQQKNTELHIFK